MDFMLLYIIHNLSCRREKVLEKINLMLFFLNLLKKRFNLCILIVVK